MMPVDVLDGRHQRILLLYRKVIQEMRGGKKLGGNLQLEKNMDTFKPSPLLSFRFKKL